MIETKSYNVDFLRDEFANITEIKKDFELCELQ